MREPRHPMLGARLCQRCRGQGEAPRVHDGKIVPDACPDCTVEAEAEWRAWLAAQEARP